MKRDEISDLKARAYLTAIIDGVLDVEVANNPLDGAQERGSRVHSTGPGQQACPRAWGGVMSALKNCAERIEREVSRAAQEVERFEAMGAVAESIGGHTIEVAPPRGEWEDLRRSG